MCQLLTRLGAIINLFMAELANAINIEAWRHSGDALPRSFTVQQLWSEHQTTELQWRVAPRANIGTPDLFE